MASLSLRFSLPLLLQRRFSLTVLQRANVTVVCTPRKRRLTVLGGTTDSTIGRPIASRSAHHRSQLTPPTLFMSSSKIFVECLESMDMVSLVPFPISMACKCLCGDRTQGAKRNIRRSMTSSGRTTSSKPAWTLLMAMSTFGLAYRIRGRSSFTKCLTVTICASISTGHSARGRNCAPCTPMVVACRVREPQGAHSVESGLWIPRQEREDLAELSGPGEPFRFPGHIVGEERTETCKRPGTAAKRPHAPPRLRCVRH